MELNYDSPVAPYVRAIVDFYAKPDDVVAILHAGSSLDKEFSECLDVDLVMFVKDDNDDGTLYIDIEGLRVEAILIPVSMAVEAAARGLRNQSLSLAEMIMVGELIFGDEREFMSPIRRQVESMVLSFRPFFMLDVVGFASNGLLSALRRASSRAHKTHLAFGILDFIGKNEGPCRGGWPMSPKYVLRLLASEEGAGSGTLQDALAKCVGGESEALVCYFERWLKEKKIEPLTSFRMMRLRVPTQQPARTSA